MQDLIAQLALLPDAEWRQVTARMNWRMRVSDRYEQPHQLGKKQLEYEEWVVLRAKVKNIRRAAKKLARDAAAEAARKLRRDYMREYMRGYRQRPENRRDD